MRIVIEATGSSTVPSSHPSSSAAPAIHYDVFSPMPDFASTGASSSTTVSLTLFPLGRPMGACHNTHEEYDAKGVTAI
ncbi:MAG: hypothetical protein ACRET3_15035 [Burkholderiales bacterium]